jgi:two-component sensor histidine kinase
MAILKLGDSWFLARPVRKWVLFVLPLITFVLASADALLLSMRGDSTSERWKLALATTMPLSAGACALTAWIQFRLRTEIDRRTSIEAQLRTALTERSQAIADLRRALERERLLLRELDHRVRNNLSSLLGLVGLYEGSGAEPAEFLRALRGRISALREVYGLIGATSGEGVDLARLLRTIAASMTPPCDGAVIHADGPRVRLQSREATAFAMIVHELFTNACKHGALRRPGGSIQALWSVHSMARGTGGARLDLSWVEAPVSSLRTSKSANEGSGLALVDGIVRADLRGSASFDNANGRWAVSIHAVLASSSSNSPTLAHEEVHAS